MTNGVAAPTSPTRVPSVGEVGATAPRRRRTIVPAKSESEGLFQNSVTCPSPGTATNPVTGPGGVMSGGGPDGGVVAPITSVPPSTATPRPGSAGKDKGRSATTGSAVETLTDTLTGGTTPKPARWLLMLTVTRELAGNNTDEGDTLMAAPASVDAWNWRIALVGVAPGFCSVRYSTNPGRTVPSAKE